MAELGAKYGDEFDMDHDPATGRVKFSRKKAGLTKEEEKWNKEQARTTTLLMEMFPEYAEKHPAELVALAEAELTDKQRIDHLNDVVGKQKMESIARDTVTQMLPLLWPEFPQMPTDFTEGVLKNLEEVAKTEKSQAAIARRIEDIKEASEKDFVMKSLVTPPTNPADIQKVELLKGKYFPNTPGDKMADALFEFSAMNEAKNSPRARSIQEDIDHQMKLRDEQSYNSKVVEESNKKISQLRKDLEAQKDVDFKNAQRILEVRKLQRATMPPPPDETIIGSGGVKYTPRVREIATNLSKQDEKTQRRLLDGLRNIASGGGERAEEAKSAISLYESMSPKSTKIEEGTEKTVGPTGTPVEEGPQGTTPTAQPTAANKKSGITQEQFNKLHGTERGAKLAGTQANQMEAPDEMGPPLSMEDDPSDVSPEEIRELWRRVDQGDKQAKARLMRLYEAARTAKQ